MGISLFHEGNKFYREKAQTSGQLIAKTLRAADLFPVIEKCIREYGVNYRLSRLGENALEIEEIIHDSKPHRINIYNYRIRLDGDCTVIHSTFKNSALYCLLARYAINDYQVRITFNGEHPFYTQDTIGNYRGKGNYHLVSVFDIQYLPEIVKEHCQHLTGYSEYWSFNFFIPSFGNFTLSNHTQNPAQPFYHLDFYHPERKLKIFQQVTERDGSYYFRDNLSVKAVVELFIGMAEELQVEDWEQVLGCFEPVHQVYSEIESTIEGETNLHSVVQGLAEYKQYIRGNLVQYEITENPDNSLSVQAYYFQRSTGYSCIVRDEDIANGHIYLGKFHDMDFLTYLCRSIAQHLCPTMPSTEDLDELEIYYREESDQELIASLFDETGIDPKYNLVG